MLWIAVAGYGIAGWDGEFGGVVEGPVLRGHDAGLDAL